MKFFIDKVILWLESGRRREVCFHPDAINVITGDSNTGKTAILQIFDYCLFSDSVKISESKINENVRWYGLSIGVNDKRYTLCRKAPSRNEPSYDFFFSSINDIPDWPVKNNNIDSIKSVFEAEFSINKDVKIPYGSKNIKPGSKVSLRYFLMFNTLSQNIISNSDVFFDMQDEDRYRDALPRIFDLAVGIDTVENILKREKREELEKELKKLVSKVEKLEKRARAIPSEIVDIVKKGKEYGLLPPDLEVDISETALRELITATSVKVDAGVSRKVKEIQKEIFSCRRKIVNLGRFAEEYSAYKSSLTTLNESLKPIAYLQRCQNDLIQTSVFKEVIDSVETQLEEIKRSIKSKTPIDNKVTELEKHYRSQLAGLYKQLSELPTETKSFDSQKEVYMFLGEAKAKLELYSRYGTEDGASNRVEIDNLENEIKQLHVVPNEDKRNLFIDMLQEIIEGYIEVCKEALDNYGDYLPVFNYREKKLQLRKPKTDFIENVGSSSNHMFLHLFLFLGLHEIIAIKEVPYVGSFLIMDQPSRPYYGTDKKRIKNIVKSDEFKIAKAFQLMNEYVQRLCKEQGKSFQCIVFEHIPVRLFDNLEHIKIVEEFTEGNALVPDSYLQV